MKLFIVLLLVIFLFGCGSPIGFDTPGDNPSWVGDLSSRIDSEGEQEAGKIRVPRSKGKRVKRVHRRTVIDIVVPPKEVPKPVEEKPPWVAQLEEKIVIKKVGKKSRRGTPEQIQQDLVTPVEPVEEAPAPLPVPVPSGEAPKVDIVFVVDASNSMDHFLRRVKKTFAGFVQALGPLNWQIMFTTADHGSHGFFLANWTARDGTAMSLEHDGRLLLGTKYLTKNMEDYASIFIDTLRISDFYEHLDNRGDQEKSKCELAPGCQGWNEQPLKSLKATFVKNRSFFRPGADVVSIVFSDSDEGENSDPSKRVKAEQVVQSFEQGLGKSGKKLVSYGIIMIPDQDEACRAKYSSGFWGGEGLFGTELVRMAELTEGSNHSICKDSYAPLARKIVADFID